MLPTQLVNLLQNASDVSIVIDNAVRHQSSFIENTTNGRLKKATCINPTTLGRTPKRKVTLPQKIDRWASCPYFFSSVAACKSKGWSQSNCARPTNPKSPKQQFGQVGHNIDHPHLLHLTSPPRKPVRHKLPTDILTHSLDLTDPTIGTKGGLQQQHS